jgi:hypothetical protein
MTSNTERWLAWVMALVALLLLLACGRSWVIGWYVLEASCRALLQGNDFMNALGGMARVGLFSFFELGFLIITLLVALGWITSRKVRIALWAFSMVLYASLTALGVAGSVASLSQPVSATTVAMDCVITICFAVITMVSVSLLRQAVASGRTLNSAVTIP